MVLVVPEYSFAFLESEISQIVRHPGRDTVLGTFAQGSIEGLAADLYNR